MKVVVYDNSGWGLVDLEMNQAGLPAASGVKFPNMDFAAFARACGMEGFTARKPGELAGAIAGLRASPGPAMLDVFVDPDELPTMPHIEPLKAVRFGIGKIRELFTGG